MKAKIAAEILDEYLSVPKTLSAVYDKVTIETQKDGLFIKAVDGAHVVLIEAKLPATAFTEYQSENQKAEYDLAKIKSILNLAKPNEVIGLETICDDAGKPTKLKFNIGNLTKICGLSPANENEPKRSNINLPAYAVLPVDDIKRICKGMPYEFSYGNTKLLLTPEEFILCSEDETDGIELKLSLKDHSTDYKCQEQVCSMFGAEYLIAMMNAVHSDKIKICIGNNYPAQVEWTSRSGSAPSWCPSATSASWP